MSTFQVLLQDICTITLGDNLAEPPDHRSYPIVGGGISPKGYASNYNVNAGTIIINCAGYSIGHAMRLDTPAYVNSDAIYLSNIDDRVIDSDYLYWYLTFELTADSVPAIENVRITLPCTLEEQKWCASQVKHYADIHDHLPQQKWKPGNFNPMKFLINSSFKNIQFFDKIKNNLSNITL